MGWMQLEQIFVMIFNDFFFKRTKDPAVKLWKIIKYGNKKVGEKMNKIPNKVLFNPL